MNERSIFAAALDIADAAERVAYLDRACGNNAALRQQVDQLLVAQGELGSFLDQPPPGIEQATTEAPITEKPGAEIGPYKLLEQIGEGGMGLVFHAKQLRPVRRGVALKIIKPGMDSKQVVARFEAERQALALMDHPNIARVLDAGATDSGRPYFVMELVRGIPITEYCDEHKLTIRQRLELFMQVCHAVQHAHQKGIIHRDLKPGNVLVAHDDTVPVPKVIDFGVAKATGQSLTDRSLFTGIAQMLGTPRYMSPEQASLNLLDVDTRSDIYSLGVLLYELLTGTTPFEEARMRTLGLDEVRRIIQEEEPPYPSTRVSTLGAALTTTAERRGIDPRRMSVTLRDDLDWIVMKALDKDRNRRYESASAFAADVQRHLNDEPVGACPPSASYLLRKYARRHRQTLVPAVIILIALMTATAVSTWQAVEAREAQRLAEAQRQRAETNFRQALWTVEGLLAAFETPEDSTSVAELRQVQTNLALKFLAGFCDDQSDKPDRRLQKGIAFVHTGRVFQVLGQREKAQEAFRQAITVFDQLVRDFPENSAYSRELASALLILATDLFLAEKVADANEYYSQGLGVWREALRRDPADFEARIGLVHAECYWLDSNLRDPKRGLETAKMGVKYAQEDPAAWMTLGIVYCQLQEWKLASDTFYKAFRKPGADDRRCPMTQSLLLLATAQKHLKQDEKALKSYEEAVTRMANDPSARGQNLVTRAEAAAVLGITEPTLPKQK